MGHYTSMPPSTSDSLVSHVPTLLSFSDCTHKLYNFTHCPKRISGIFNVIANNLHRIDWTGQVRYWTQSLLWTCCLLASKEQYIFCLTKSVCLWVSQVKGSNCFAWSPLHEYRAGADSLTSAHIWQQNNDGGNGIIFVCLTFAFGNNSSEEFRQILFQSLIYFRGT